MTAMNDLVAYGIASSVDFSRNDLNFATYGTSGLLMIANARSAVNDDTVSMGAGVLTQLVFAANPNNNGVTLENASMENIFDFMMSGDYLHPMSFMQLFMAVKNYMEITTLDQAVKTGMLHGLIANMNSMAAVFPTGIRAGWMTSEFSMGLAKEDRFAMMINGGLYGWGMTMGSSNPTIFVLPNNEGFDWNTYILHTLVVDTAYAPANEELKGQVAIAAIVAANEEMMSSAYYKQEV
eukprot:scpid44694/ scgid6987/ 